MSSPRTTGNHRATSARKLPLVWVKQHDQYFKDTTLRHQKVDATFDYADRISSRRCCRPSASAG